MSYRDSERFRKVYSYFRPVPRPTDNTYGSGVTKDYVDDLFNSLDWKQSVQYASDKNVDLTAVHTLVNDVDSAFLGGQLLVDEDRVLLRAQTNPAENGLYIWYTATSKFVRTLDSAQDSITCGATCYVDTGSFGGQVWLMESVDPITVDTSPQVWTMLVSLSGSANDVVQYFTSSLAGYVSTTGSMSFNGGDASVNETWNVGSDVFFYVSGTKGLDGSAGKVSVFGGDMVVSGNIDITDGNVEITGSLYVSGGIAADTLEVTGTVYATQGFSGSLTNLTDGTSFIAAGDNITVTSASNGQITITGMSSAPMLWTEVSPVVGSPGAISTTSSVVIGQFSTSSFGTDVMFYVTSSFGSPRQASVFMGDVVVSGNLGLGGDRLEITGSLDVSGAFNVTGSTFSVNSTSLTMTSDVVKVTGTVASTLGFSGSLTNLTDGTSFIAAGDNITVTSASNGQIMITAVIPEEIDVWTDRGNTLVTTSSVGIGTGSFFTSVGTDVFFYVSGSTRLTGSAGKVSVFGGDVVVSGNIDLAGDTVEITGSLYVSGVFDIMADTLEVTGTVYATQGFSGSLTNLTDGKSYLVAGENVTVSSASNGQITITAVIPEEIDVWTDLGNTLVTTSSVGVGTSSSLTSVGTDVFFYVSGSSVKKAVFGGDVMMSGSVAIKGSLLDVAADRVEITGSLAVSGAFDVTGDTVEITGSLYVSGVCDIKGDVAVSGSALLFGGVAFNVLSCSSGPGSVYYVSASTTVVVLDHGTVTAALPLNAPIGTFFIFKDGAGDASSGPKYISASLGSIDGSATTTLPSSSYSSIMVVKIGETDKWIKHS